MPIGANKLERIQQKSSALGFNRFFPHVHYSYTYVLEQLKLQALRKRKNHLDALFLVEVYLCYQFCPSVLETVGLRGPAWYVRDSFLFNVCPSSKTCPSSRCASAANVVCRDIHVF
jgi:hypothetical protein